MDQNALKSFHLRDSVLRLTFSEASTFRNRRERFSSLSCEISFVFWTSYISYRTVPFHYVPFRSRLSFDDHVKSICPRICLEANRNVSALSMAAKVIDPPKCKLLYNSFVMSNFRYCPIIWMFCGRAANMGINRVHKRALRILLKDYDASFDELLIRNEEKTVHVQNLQKLMIEDEPSMVRNVLIMSYF